MYGEMSMHKVALTCVRVGGRRVLSDAELAFFHATCESCLENRWSHAGVGHGSCVCGGRSWSWVVSSRGMREAL